VNETVTIRYELHCFTFDVGPPLNAFKNKTIECNAPSPIVEAPCTKLYL